MNKIPSDGFPVAALPAGQAPAPDFEASVCLKGEDGKCGHLWQISTNYESGNPKGTFKEGKEPKEAHRVCLRSPSNEMPLNGLVVFTCNEHTDEELREDPKPFVLPENLPPLVPPPAVMPTACNQPPPAAPTATVVGQTVVRPIVARPAVARPTNTAPAVTITVARVLDLSKLPTVKMNKDK